MILSENFVKRFLEMAGIHYSQPYINKLKNQNPNKEYIVVSTDDTLMKKAKPLGMDYNTAWNHFKYEDVHGEFMFDLRRALKKRHNIIIDRTNLSREDRKPLLKEIPAGYKKVAIIFNVSQEEVMRRLKKRELETGKSIPDDVMKKKFTEFVPPLDNEFDKVLYL